MKVRIGVGAAGASSTPEALAELVTGLDELGFDSLWLSEVLTGPVLDPVVGLAWAAGEPGCPGQGAALGDFGPRAHVRAGARGHRRRAQAPRRGDRRGAAAVAALVGGRGGEPRRPRGELPRRHALAAAGAAAARSLAGRGGARRARTP